MTLPAVRRAAFALLCLLIAGAAALPDATLAKSPGPATGSHGAGDAGGAAAPATVPGALCVGYGPQIPRDISKTHGSNPVLVAPAPPPSDMTLCNIHMHTNAEHKGPGFQRQAQGKLGGYQCNDTAALSQSELYDPAMGRGPFANVIPGDTVEVHWVYTSCNVDPGPGLRSCLSDSCANPTLRVESQVFLVVNDPHARDFMAYAYQGHRVEGRAQPRALPLDTGTPVVFGGSTTGPSFTQSTCSPLQVTWSVRPNCARVNISSIYDWARAGNVFGEDHSHGVRDLVTAPELLSPIR